MLDWPFPESLDNGYEELEGSAGRDFGSTTMFPRSPSTTTSTLAPPPSLLEPSSSAGPETAMLSSTSTNTATSTSTGATTAKDSSTEPTTETTPTTNATSSSTPLHREPASLAPSKSRTIAKASSSAPSTVTDLPSISASSSSAPSPATRPGAFLRRRPAAPAESTDPSASKIPKHHLDDRPTCWWYSKGCTSIENDFILISEFSEIEGPRAVMTVPDNVIDLTFDSFAAAKQKDGGTGARSLSNCLDGNGASTSGAGMTPSASRDQQKAFDVHEFVLRITSVDHQSREMSDSFHIPEDIEVYICESEQHYWAYVHHFTLFDVNARGFVRPFNISYITRDPNKILPNYEDIRRKFSKAAQYFKMGNYALFRHELTRKLKDLNYTNNLLSEASEATEKPVNDPTAHDGPSEEQHNEQDPSMSSSSAPSPDSGSNNSRSGNSSPKENNSTSSKRAEAGTSAMAMESTKAELASIKEAIEQATQIVSMLEHYSIDGQPLLGHLDESGENVQTVGAPAPLSDVSPMNSSENLASIASGRPGGLNDMSLFLGAQGRSGLRIRRKASTPNVARILEGSGSAAGGASGVGTLGGGAMLDNNLSASSPLLSGLQEQSRKNSIVSEYESTMMNEPEYEPQYITSLYPLARDEIVFRTLRELCVTPMYWNSSIHFHLGIKKLKDILKDYHDDALLFKQTADDIRRMHPTSSSLTFGNRFQINFRNPDFTSTVARPSSPSIYHEEPSPVPLVELLHGISMVNTISDDGESVLSLAHPHQRHPQQPRPPQHSQPPPTSISQTQVAPLGPSGTAASAGQFDADDADDEETGYDSFDDTSSFFTAVTGPAGYSADIPVRESFTVTPMDRSARVVEWRQEQHSLRHKRSSRTLPGDHGPGDHHHSPAAFEAGVSLRDVQPFALHQSQSAQRLSDGNFGSAGVQVPGVRANRLSGQSGVNGGSIAAPGGVNSGYAGGPTTRIPLSGSLILKTLKEETATAKHLLFALWSGKRVCIMGGPELEARIRKYVAVLSVFVPHVGFPTREEQLVEHQRQVVLWHQGYDLLRASDFSAATTAPATAPTAPNTIAAKPTTTGAPSPPSSVTPPLLLVGVDRSRVEPAVFERKDICILHLDTLEMVNPVDYADGLVLETIFRSVDHGLFTDDGSLLAFVDSTLFDLLLKAFLYYHLVLQHRIFQHPHLLQHLHVGGVGGATGYGYQSIYSSACSDDGETFSYRRHYHRPSRQQSSSSSKLTATSSKYYNTLPSSTSPTMIPGIDFVKKRATSKSAGGGNGGSQPHPDRAGSLSSRESSDTEKAIYHPHKTSDSNGANTSYGKTEDDHRGMTSSSNADWTRRINKRASKGKDRYRQQHRIMTSGGVGLVDESAEDEDGKNDDDAHPMQYTTMQGMRKWKKWFDYWSAKSAAMIDPALAVFGKPESQTGNHSRDSERDRERSSRASSRRSSPSGRGYGHRRVKTTHANNGNSGGVVGASQHHLTHSKVREHRQRHEREKERDRRRDRERDRKATGAQFDMRRYSDQSDDSDNPHSDDNGGAIGDEEIGVFSNDEPNQRRPSSCHQDAPHPLDTDKGLPSLPKSPVTDRQDGGVGLGISSHESSSHKVHHHHHHLPSALKRLHSTSRKLQPKVPLSLQSIKKGGDVEAKEGGNRDLQAKSPTDAPTTSPSTSPPGSGTLRGLTGALRAMSFGAAFGSPTTTTSTTAVIATAASGSTVTTTTTTTTSSTSPPTSTVPQHVLLSPSASSSSQSLGHPNRNSVGSVHELVEKNVEGKVKRRSSKRAKAKAWLEAKRKKHWHRHGSRDDSVPHTAEDDDDEEGEDGEDEGEEGGERQENRVADDSGDGQVPQKSVDDVHGGSVPKDELKSPSVSRTSAVESIDSKPEPSHPASSCTVTPAGAEDLSSTKAMATTTIATVAAADEAKSIAGDPSDMFTIEEIAQLEPTTSSARTASPPRSAPSSSTSTTPRTQSGRSNRVSSHKGLNVDSTVPVGDVSGRESATEYETSMETWVTHVDRQNDDDYGNDDNGAAQPWKNIGPTEAANPTQPTEHTEQPEQQSSESDPYELTEEVVAVIKELVGGISGEDDWSIVMYLAKLVYAYEKTKEASASPSLEK
ncbi:Guanine nucleotide exchange protein smcr8 [Actinomortierella wolfii]|nr:Guanine nucleotide exchange protein smcr8 [Actinomortierella wolfii]